MINARLIPLCSFLLFIQCAEEKKPEILKTAPLFIELVPTNATTAKATIFSLNCWVDKGKIFATGICVNDSPDWQKFWLDATPVDAAGKPLSISKHSSIILKTFSDAVPPNGRTSFFASWPLTDFSSTPASFIIKVAGAIKQTPGPILVIPMTSAMKMLDPAVPGQPDPKERAWLVSGTINNPLQIVASRPRLEVLVFDTEGTLWLSTLLNPEDPAVKSVFHFDREGPIQPNEARGFSLQVSYEILPLPLQEKKIGRVDILPFEARN